MVPRPGTSPARTAPTAATPKPAPKVPFAGTTNVPATSVRSAAKPAIPTIANGRFKAARIWGTTKTSANVPIRTRCLALMIPTRLSAADLPAATIIPIPKSPRDMSRPGVVSRAASSNTRLSPIPATAIRFALPARPNPTRHNASAEPKPCTKNVKNVRMPTNTNLVPKAPNAIMTNVRAPMVPLPAKPITSDFAMCPRPIALPLAIRFIAKAAATAPTFCAVPMTPIW